MQMPQVRDSTPGSAGVQTEVDYRTYLYDAYVTTHFGMLREISVAAVDRHRRVFHHYFGQLLPPNRDARILEIGCGFGPFLYYLEKAGYAAAEGVDISPEQVSSARQLGLSNVICGDAIAYLEQSQVQYDCIVGLDLIEHFTKGDAIRLLRLVWRRLRPGGRVILQTPNAYGPFAGRFRYHDLTHEFSLTPQSARQLLRATGFGDISVIGAEPYVHGIRSLSRVIVWSIIKVLLWGYMVAETGILRGHNFAQNIILVAFRPASDDAPETAAAP